MVGEQPQVAELTRGDRIAPETPPNWTLMEGLLSLPRGHRHPRKRLGEGVATFTPVRWSRVLVHSWYAETRLGRILIWL